MSINQGVGEMENQETTEVEALLKSRTAAEVSALLEEFEAAIKSLYPNPSYMNCPQRCVFAGLTGWQKFLAEGREKWKNISRQYFEHYSRDVIRYLSPGDSCPLCQSGLTSYQEIVGWYVKPSKEMKLVTAPAVKCTSCFYSNERDSVTQAVKKVAKTWVAVECV
jgi:hypothetical protein